MAHRLTHTAMLVTSTPFRTWLDDLCWIGWGRGGGSQLVRGWEKG